MLKVARKLAPRFLDRFPLAYSDAILALVPYHISGGKTAFRHTNAHELSFDDLVGNVSRKIDTERAFPLCGSAHGGFVGKLLRKPLRISGRKTAFLLSAEAHGFSYDCPA